LLQVFNRGAFLSPPIVQFAMSHPHPPLQVHPVRDQHPLPHPHSTAQTPTRPQRPLFLAISITTSAPTTTSQSDSALELEFRSYPSAPCPHPLQPAYSQVDLPTSSSYLYIVSLNNTGQGPDWFGPRYAMLQQRPTSSSARVTKF
jgi:hypothetical protein